MIYYQYHSSHLDFVVQLSSFLGIILFNKFVVSSYDTAGYISRWLGRLLHAKTLVMHEKCYCQLAFFYLLLSIGNRLGLLVNQSLKTRSFLRRIWGGLEYDNI